MKKLVVAAALLSAASFLVAQIYTTGDAPVTITDDSGGALSDCQDITVPAGQPNVAGSVSVTVTAAHTWVGDLTFELTSPGATSVTILNRPGRTATGAGNSDDLQDATPIIFADGAVSGASAETMGDAPCGGLIDGSADCPSNYTPAPDAGDTPIAGSGTDLSDFMGEDPTGTWTLCASDSAGGDTGTLTSWTIDLEGATVPVELMTFSIE